VEETLRAAARFLAQNGAFRVALEEYRLEAFELDGVI
jgi:hypothetical protein